MERIDKLKEMLAASPEDCFLLHALGLEYMKLNEVETAVVFFEKVLSVDENYVGTYYHLAKACEKMNDKHKAIAIYEKGIAIAQGLKDNHARNELQMALDEITE